MPVIGFLYPTSSDMETDRLRTFREGLKDTGYLEGDNVTIEYRFAENQLDRLHVLAADLVARRVAVIVAMGGRPVVLAAKAATNTIPIVFLIGEDPVKLGLVASIAQPGGNLTGINFFAVELVAKRLELLREMVPGAARVAVLVNRKCCEYRVHVERCGVAARTMGLQIQVINANTVREIDAAFATFSRDRPDALLVGSGPLFTTRRVRIGPLGGTIWPSRDICRTATYRSGRAHELRSEPNGCDPSGWGLYRPHPKGSKARRYAGRAIDQVRTGHQFPNCADARPRNPRHCSPAPTR